jgi:hypothetical protein
MSTNIGEEGGKRAWTGDITLHLPGGEGSAGEEGAEVTREGSSVGGRYVYIIYSYNMCVCVCVCVCECVCVCVCVI